MARKQKQSFLDEWESLVAEKQQIDADLGSYSNAAMLKEQQRIRRKAKKEGKNSFNAWVNRKGFLAAERQILVGRKSDIEQRMAKIKDRAMQERRDLRPEDENLQVRKELLTELRSIRELLEQVLARADGAQ